MGSVIRVNPLKSRIFREKLNMGNPELRWLIGGGNNPMVGMTVAVAVSIEEAATAGKF